MLSTPSAPAGGDPAGAAPSGTATHCPYCALQCAQTLTAAAGGGADGGPVLTVEGRDFPTNQGGLCRKGWTSAEVLTAPDRLTAPQLRGR